MDIRKSLQILIPGFFLVLTSATIASAKKSTPAMECEAAGESVKGFNTPAAELVGNIQKDPVFAAYIDRLRKKMTGTNMKEAKIAIKTYRELMCLLATGINNVHRNLDSGQWSKGGWGENWMKTKPKAWWYDPDDKAENPKSAQDSLWVLNNSRIPFLKKRAEKAKGKEKEKYKTSVREALDLREELKENLKRSWGLCRHWATNNADAIKAANPELHYVGSLQLKNAGDPAEWIVAGGSEHNVVQICPLSCGGPCLIFDAWGGTRIMSKSTFLGTTWSPMGESSDRSPCGKSK